MLGDQALFEVVEPVGQVHLVDVRLHEATVFSPYSRNRQYGEAFIRGEPFAALAEGCHTVRALRLLEQRTGVELPICHTVYQILYQARDPQEALGALFTARSLKREF